MERITYLFGAGASYYALPVINELPSRIANILSRKLFKDIKGKMEGVNKHSHDKLKTHYELIKLIEWLQKEASKHQTVDTFAKKLFVRGDNENLIKLKIALSAYFMLEQSVDDDTTNAASKDGKKRLDYRYDSFFASILGKNAYDLPKHVNVLSWNYDYQFEMAYSEYTLSKLISENQGALHVKSKNSTDENIDCFNIIKINGTVGSKPAFPLTKPIIPSDNLELDLGRVFDEIVDWYIKIRKNNTIPDLSFAWEEDIDAPSSIVNKAISACQETTVLVVIGYSFPFFNREIDRKIINSMKNLRTVYFQDLYPNSIMTKFKTIRQNILLPGSIEMLDFIPYDVISDFLLPPEL